MRRRGIILAALGFGVLVVAVLTPWYLRLERERHISWLSAEMVKRSSAMHVMIQTMREQARSGAHVPESLEALATLLEQKGEDWIITRDENRLFVRAALLRDITTPKGERYKWLIVAVLPKFDTLTEDLICFGGGAAPGQPPLNENDTHLLASEARGLLGPEAVEAAYRRYNEDLGKAAPRASSRSR